MATAERATCTDASSGFDDAVHASTSYSSAVQPESVGDGSDSDSDDVRAAVPDYKYKDAPEALRGLLDAPPFPTQCTSPDRRYLAVLESDRFRSLYALSLPEVPLAGFRLHRHTNSASRDTVHSGLVIVDLQASPVRHHRIALPHESRISECVFSPDSRYLAMVVRAPACDDAATDSVPNPILLYAVDTTTMALARVSWYPVCKVLGKTYTWLPDSTGLLFRTPRVDRGPVPERPQVPTGPVVLESGLGHDVKRRAGGDRTYQDLLKDSFDCRLFEYYCSSQVVHARITGDCVLLPISGLLRSVQPSPDGRYLLVKTILRPFSYFVLWQRFPMRISVHLLTPQAPLVRDLVTLQLADSVPVSFDACRVGPRHVSWRADAASTLTWVEAQDAGDPKVVPPDGVRDVVWSLSAPFRSAPTFVCSLKFRFKELRFAPPELSLALVTEKWVKTRQSTTWLVQFGDDGKAPKTSLVWTGSYEDRYTDPGQPQMHTLANGARVLNARSVPGSGPIIDLVGDGASPEGDRPFYDQFDLATKTSHRVWQSRPPNYESVITVISPSALLIRRESASDPPNMFIVDVAGSTPDIAVTSTPHPCPELRNVKPELVHYKREDGVELSGYLYRPPNFDGQALPTVLWAYPREFKSKEAAGQTQGSPYTFTFDGRPSLFFLLEGYAVLDRMTMPIVAEGDAEPNDTYVEQLVANARAAVEHLVDIGVADRERIGIGGHSYGAFMTANLVAHSNLFAAGIARSGAYNRTLTPNGFQREERTLWQAPEVYYKMSPYMAADRIKSPLLLIHGAADNNTGTYPMQSERMFAALKGHGKAPARFVCLPCESHHYKSRESAGHVIWEMTRWFNRHVKHKGDPKHVRTRSEFF
ncbi:Peptidase S9 prolyl oligopeptidase catalytic domain-containing protein [Plasmodiophora brassicae]|uniref:Peptidase S9 prolyl oligopeptidase catalytic domain-containing protein n=1 Tax=Plasmodiophora brassicae TaxID=37360 RepID=A0A3P3Y9Y1_PLABS|nr:unnamed protein product [Plasmodiophora brassicae]